MEKEFLFNVLDQEGNTVMIIKNKNNSSLQVYYPEFDNYETILKSRKEFVEMSTAQIAMLVYTYSKTEYKRFERELIEYKGWNKICPNCGKPIVDNNIKSKYCNICKHNYNEIRSNNRKSNKCRYLHKKICDKLKYKNIDTAAFRLESNYYWDIINNKNIAINDIYDNSIKTENDYYNWLCYKINSI